LNKIQEQNVESQSWFISMKTTAMAQIELNNIREQKNKALRFHKRPLPDMTPMVDLGFLLITFFIFTSRLSEPSKLNLFLPEDGPPIKVMDSKTITVLLTGDNKAAWYDGKTIAEPKLHFTLLQGDGGLRKVLLQKQQKVKSKWGDAHEMFVIIKPTRESNYQALVDVLDEMLINDITRYTLIDPDKTDMKMLYGNQ
jgi:biopolymer transport protein ExbD